MTNAVDQDALYRQAEREFAPAIARLANALEANAAKADELKQEMHCAIWQSLTRFRGDSALKTWVFRVAHNVGADHVRRQVRAPNRVPLEDIQSLSIPGSGEGEAEKGHVLRKVQELLQRLEPFDAQVIILWLEGQTGSEIAEITGLSANAAQVRIHRVKALIAAEFADPSEKENNHAA